MKSFSQDRLLCCFLYLPIIFSRSLSVIGQSSHWYTPHSVEKPPSGKINLLPHLEQYVSSKAGGFGSFSKLYSFVPYQTYISGSKSSRHFLQVFQSPLCSSAWCEPQSVNRLWLREQISREYENIIYSFSLPHIQLPQHSVLNLGFFDLPHNPHGGVVIFCIFFVTFFILFLVFLFKFLGFQNLFHLAVKIRNIVFVALRPILLIFTQRFIFCLFCAH